MKTYDEFKNAMGMRESSNRYDCINTFYFLGRYQFGSDRLQDLGLKKATGLWIDGMTQELFLENHALQDNCFDVHVGRLKRAIDLRFEDRIGMEIQGVDITESGMVAVAHLLGLGGLADWIRGRCPTDALGTSAAEYARTFSDYEIPEGLPDHVNLKLIKATQS